MSQLSEIYAGWKNIIFPNPEVEAQAKKRIIICVSNECKNFRKNKSCKLCGCYMPAKVRSPKSKCDIGKW
jgi:hypothetical protein